jgi:hypothetical protein
MSTNTAVTGSAYGRIDRPRGSLPDLALVVGQRYFVAIGVGEAEGGRCVAWRKPLGLGQLGFFL